VAFGAWRMARSVIILVPVLASATLQLGCGGDDGTGASDVSPTPTPFSPELAPTLPPPGGSLSCPLDSAEGVQIVDDLLDNLTPLLNEAWPSLAAELGIDPLEPVYSGSVGLPCKDGGDEACGFHVSSCKSAKLDVSVPSLTGLGNLRFQNLAVDTLNGRSASFHSNPGPDASKITDGISAAQGASYDDPSYAVVLPNVTGVPSVGLTVDLGQVVTVCGNGYDCKSRPVIQADHNDVYQLDYSTDGLSWTRFGVFPAVSGGGLQVRAADPDAGNVAGNRFDTRYVRVYPISGDGKYSVSELTLWDRSSNVISVGKPATGPEPLITNGDYAPEGTSYNDSRYAVVLNGVGETFALHIDLGADVPVTQLGLQADSNDEYEVDMSEDGVSWQYLWTAPQDSSGGLRTRSSPFFQSGVHGRYFRVYATTGDGKYSVSELEVDTTQTVATECPYDSSANNGQNFSCSDHGLFSGFAFLLQGTEIVATIEDLTFVATCEIFGIPGGDFPVYFIPPVPFTCVLSDPSGTAAAHFCAGSCAAGSPPSAMSYAKVTNLEIDGGDITCDTSAPTGISDSVVNDVIALLKPKLVDALTPPIEDVLNDLLADYIPFPGSCSADSSQGTALSEETRAWQRKTKSVR
jgi:hypothetical protein